MAQVKNNPIPLDNTTKLFGTRDNVPGEVVPGFLGVHNLLHVQDQKPAGTHGGTFTSGAWRTRELNSIVLNNISQASLNLNVITLPAGTYFLQANSSAYACGTHQLRFYNKTNSLEILRSTSLAASSSNFGGNEAFIFGTFSLSASSDFELQHICSTTRPTDGMGLNLVAGETAIYSDLKIWKLA